MPKKVKIEIPNTITGNSNLDKGLAEFPEMKNLEAFDVALALQQLVRGQSSILSQLNDNKKGTDLLAQEVSKIKERMASYDKTAELYEKDRDKFVADVIDKSKKKKATGSKKDKLIANGVSKFKQEIGNEKALLVNDRLSFEQEIARMKQVMVTSPGKLETVMQGGIPTPVLFGEEIRIKHKVWLLKPNVPTMVPEIVAIALEERRRVESENRERQTLLAKNLEYNKYQEEYSKLNSKHNSNSNLQGESYGS